MVGKPDDDLAAIEEEVVGGVPTVGEGEFEPVACGRGGGVGEEGADFLLVVVEVADLDEGAIRYLGSTWKRERKC